MDLAVLNSWQSSVAVFLVAVFTILFFKRSASKRLRPVKPGETVLITGASSGIGRATALYLADEVGFRVIGTVRKESDGEALKAAARHPERIVPILMDVTRPPQVQAAVKMVETIVGENGLAALFNNAGTSQGGGPLEITPLSAYRELFEINFFGLIGVTQAFLPLVRKAKGRIINNSSIAGLSAMPHYSTYSSSKAAVESLSDSLRRELIPHGVKVVVIEPGPIQSEIARKLDDARNANTDWKTADRLYPMYRQVQKYHNKAHESDADPRLVYTVVDEAIRSPSPRARYAPNAPFVLFVLRMLPEWLSDKLILRTLSKF